jgi:FMN-dependent oxidoreductase (nitrilotriacetate monooxygenase family)
MKRMMRLAAFSHAPGVHRAGWRLKEAAVDGDSDFSVYLHLAQTAERGKMDTVFFQDSVAIGSSTALMQGNRTRGQLSYTVTLEPLSLLPALAVLTSRIGLISTATTTYNEPYHIARKFATIDHVSKGRAGWNLVTSQAEDEAFNFGLEQHVDHAVRYERAAEFHDVVVGLWDSWDPDAMVRDKSTGIYFDVDKVHFLNHKGKHFSVRGPLNVVRTPQGRPVVAQAGSSPAGRALAARTAEVIFTAQSEFEEAKEFYEDVKGRAAVWGRCFEDIKILPGILPIIGSTDCEAQERFEELQSLITDDMCLWVLQRLTGGVDLSQYPIDGPLPELKPSNAAKARQQIMINLGRKGMNIREIGRYFCSGSGHRLLVGSPATIADRLEEWFVGGAADGFTVLFAYLPGGIDRWVDMVIPELQRRGLFRTEYESDTLRGNLGLRVPQSRYGGEGGGRHHCVGESLPGVRA